MLVYVSCWCIFFLLLYIILLYITFIILYLILYYTLLFFRSVLPSQSSLPLPILLPFLQPSPVIPSSPISSFILYVSVLTYTYLYSGDDSRDNILTPHVLSEWMVEVCRFHKCGVRCSCWWIVIGFWFLV